MDLPRSYFSFTSVCGGVSTGREWGMHSTLPYNGLVRFGQCISTMSLLKVILQTTTATHKGTTVDPFPLGHRSFPHHTETLPTLDSPSVLVYVIDPEGILDIVIFLVFVFAQPLRINAQNKLLVWLELNNSCPNTGRE